MCYWEVESGVGYISHEEERKKGKRVHVSLKKVQACGSGAVFSPSSPPPVPYKVKSRMGMYARCPQEPIILSEHYNSNSQKHSNKEARTNWRT